MTFEIIKSFCTIEATVHCLASRRSELADEFSVKRVAMWALNSFVLKHLGCTELLFWIRWRNAELF